MRSRKWFKKTAEATGDLIENKITDKITRFSKTLPKTNTETNQEKILRERFVASEERYKTIVGLRLRKENYWLFIINIIIK